MTAFRAVSLPFFAVSSENPANTSSTNCYLVGRRDNKTFSVSVFAEAPILTSPANTLQAIVSIELS